jgi:hypothetical protein
LTEMWSISLVAIIVDKVCSMVLYKPCTMTILTCISNLPDLKKL